ncbi:MAG: hypothetical protein AAGU78_16950 [Chloroflexota bacterium]
MERSRNLQGILILLALLALGGLYLWQNVQPGITVSVPAPTATTGDVRSWPRRRRCCRRWTPTRRR